MRFTTETVVTSGSRVKRVLTRVMSKWTKHIVTFSEEEDEETLSWRKDLKLNGELHSTTHIPFRAWCSACVASRAKEDPHWRKRIEDAQEKGHDIVSFDFGFLGNSTAGREDCAVPTHRQDSANSLYGREYLGEIGLFRETV